MVALKTKDFLNDSGSFGHFPLKARSSWLMVQTEKLKMVSCWDITVEQIFQSPLPPHRRSRLLTPLVGLAMWPEWPVKCEPLWNDHVWAEVACCAVGSMLLPFTTGERAPASCCPFIMASKIERHETTPNPAWSPAAEGLTYAPTGKDGGSLLETMESWGSCLLYSIS